MTIEQVNRQIQGGKLERETLLFILKNIRTIRAQAATSINTAARDAARNIWQYVQCLLELLPEDEEDALHALYVENKPWVETEMNMHISRNTLGRRRKMAIKRMLDMANGTMEAFS